jgi:hypothetical protein
LGGVVAGYCSLVTVSGRSRTGRLDRRPGAERVRLVG